MKLSAAFPAMKLYSVIDKACLQNFDYINIMAYDNGPWQPKVVRQHSSYELAENSIDFWSEICRNSPKKKIILFMPCYGWEFGKSVRNKTSSSLVDKNKELAFR